MRKAQLLDDISGAFGKLIFEYPGEMALVIEEDLEEDTVPSEGLGRSTKRMPGTATSDLLEKIDKHLDRRGLIFEGESRITPALWRQLDPVTVNQYRQLALVLWEHWLRLSRDSSTNAMLARANSTGGKNARLGQWTVHSFDLNLETSLEARLSSEASADSTLRAPSQIMRRRIAKNFDDKTPYWFALEEAPVNGRLHIHGSIAIQSGTQSNKQCRSDLLRVAGFTPNATTSGPSAIGYALRMTEYTDFEHLTRRASYPIKGNRHREGLHRVTKPVTDQPLTQLAKRVHEFHRRRVARMLESVRSAA